MRGRARIGRLITSLLVPGLLLACESRRAGGNGEHDGPATGRAEDSLGEFSGERAANSVRIGVVDGDDTQVFGQIREIAVDDVANVYVLDDQALTLKRFDRDGTFRGGAGRSGGGPGEFRAPTGLALDDNGRIQVLDMAHRRITTFATVDTVMNLVDEFTIPFHAVDFCRLGSRYFVLSVAQDDGIIHEIAADGRVLLSFGESPIEIPDEIREHAQLMRDNGARGRLICISDPPTVVFVPEMIPRVQAFSPEGKLLWAVALANYRQRRWEFSPPNGVRMAPDPATGTAHTAVDAALVGAELIGVTLHEGSVANPEGHLELRTISLEDGREHEPRKAAGILASVRHDRLYTYVNDPFPLITIAPIATQR
jgi:hypothetical protein